MLANKIVMLLVLATPSFNDAYYSDFYEDIIEFQINYAKAVTGKDKLAILADKKTAAILRDHLPTSIIIENPMYDIWIRDFSTVSPHNPILFKYSKAAQAGYQKISDAVQKKFRQFIDHLDISYQKTNLILDGGNFVDNYHDKIVVTERFLEDNNITKTEAKSRLKDLLKVPYIAIIPYDDDILAHADGMLMFIEKNTIVLNKYEEPFRNSVIKELYQSFPDLKIVEIDMVLPEHNTQQWDENFFSACGIYVNAVVTDQYIYLPTFNNSYDEIAISTIGKHTHKKVIPIDASSVCQMGGSLRCLSWQIAGTAAELIKK